MCVNSCVKTRRSQSSVLPMNSDPAGHDRGDDDGVVGQGRGRSVGELRLIDEHDVGQRRRRPAERHAELLPGVFRDRRQPRGQAIFALMEVDDEVLGGERAKAKGRIEHATPPGRRARRRGAASALIDSRMIRGRAGHIFEEQQVCRGPEMNAGQRALRDGVVGLVPQADIRHFLRQNLLDLAEEPQALRGVGRRGCLIDQPIDARVAEVAAVETGRRRLLGVEHAAEDVRIGRVPPVHCSVYN